MNVNRNFLPKFTHPYYFIRTAIYQGINERARYLNGVLLDFGCGEKPYQSLFNVEKYIGLDYENTGHDHKNENIDVFYNGTNIPFDDGYFDSVLCSEVLEHVFDIDRTLQEINRILKNGGKLLVTCPFVWNEHEVPYDYARYTVFALKHLFEKHGFRVLEFDKKGDFIKTITQMKVLYFYYHIKPYLPKFPGSYYFSSAWIALLNRWGSWKSSLFKKKYDLYLTNVFLVEKYDGGIKDNNYSV
jgi:ubiquinone/menaquinone biosynthesis C-methylase UbiE